ncbi:MAG: DUF4469 domain-containing protein [Treponema sp.]|jgi:hypothetical protein|nr:DUF4469 domain-containing protein [Treponema sp.]
MLDYFLELNPLTSDNPDDMRAQTANVISHNQADIIDRILKTGAEDSFDRKRHSVRIHLSEGIGLRAVEERVKPKKIAPLPTGPRIISVTDVKTGSVNRLLTPGKNLRVSGIKIKIAGDDPSVGVYFTLADAEVKADAAAVPALAPGNYYVKLITRFTGSGKSSKTLHTASFDTPLTVPAEGR